MSGMRDEDVAGEISRRPGGYQTKTAPSGDLLVKGGTLKGWITLTIRQARKRFGIPYPAPEKRGAR